MPKLEIYVDNEEYERLLTKAVACPTRVTIYRADQTDPRDFTRQIDTTYEEYTAYLNMLRQDDPDETTNMLILQRYKGVIPDIFPGKIILNNLDRITESQLREFKDALLDRFSEKINKKPHTIPEANVRRAMGIEAIDTVISHYGLADGDPLPTTKVAALINTTPKKVQATVQNYFSDFRQNLRKPLPPDSLKTFYYRLHAYLGEFGR